MARGKHGQSAQAKADEKATLRIRALEAELTAAHEAHRLTRVELQAVKDRAAGDVLAIKRAAAEAAVIGVEEELAAARAEIEERKVGFRIIGGALDRVAVKLEAALRQNGMTKVEAYETVLHIAKYVAQGDYYVPTSDLVVTNGSGGAVNTAKGRKEVLRGSAEEKQVKRLQVARGLRHADPVPSVDQ